MTEQNQGQAALASAVSCQAMVPTGTMRSRFIYSVSTFAWTLQQMFPETVQGDTGNTPGHYYQGCGGSSWLNVIFPHFMEACQSSSQVCSHLHSCHHLPLVMVTDINDGASFPSPFISESFQHRPAEHHKPSDRDGF
jgi:hypothetical protein